MNRFFEEFYLIELEQMFREVEQSINKTGMFDEGSFVYEIYKKWLEERNQPMPLLFLFELYYEICKHNTM